MIYHVLNGDGLAVNFDLPGEKIVCRECLIEGSVRESLDEHWQIRAGFIKETHGVDDYLEKVKSEFDKLQGLTASDEVNFWFGNEAFCQVNLWFCLYLVEKTGASIYRVFPDGDGWQCSFRDLRKCFERRRKFSTEDTQIGANLWKAYCSQKFTELTDSDNFPYLNEVCQAIIEKDILPPQIINEIRSTGETDFDKIFAQFRAKAGIYGYGDSQVKNLLDF